MINQTYTVLILRKHRDHDQWFLHGEADSEEQVKEGERIDIYK